MKIKTPVTEKIEFFLIKHPHLRDDDNKLIATVWRWQLFEVYNKKVEDMSAMELLKYYASRQLASAESIRRSRAKLQEIKPTLRGDKYEERHKEAEKVKDELNKWEDDGEVWFSVSPTEPLTIRCSCNNPKPIEWGGVVSCEECGQIISEPKTSDNEKS